MIEHVTKAGEVLDLLCYQYQGNANDIERVLSRNPQLAACDEQSLPAGVVIEFEEIVVQQVPTSVNLWD